MSLDLVNMINHVVNECREVPEIIGETKRFRAKAKSFNKIVTLDLKEFGNKYILWMIDSFTLFIQGKLLSNKKAETIIQALTDT